MNRLKIILKLLLGQFQGADADPANRVLAGLDAIIKVNGKTIGWATNISWDEDFELQGVRTLGYHGDRGYKSQGYNCTATVGTFVLRGGALADALPTPTRDTILTSGAINFEILDNTEPSGVKTIYTLWQCKCATKGVSLDSGSLITKSTTWRCREVRQNLTNAS